MRRFMFTAVTRSVLLALSLGLWQQSGSAAPRPAAANPVRQQYIAIGCSECHGRAGQGGFAPALAHTALDYAAFRNQVRNPSNTMPAYTAKVLNDADLRALYDFVRALPGPQAVKGFSMLEPHK